MMVCLDGVYLSYIAETVDIPDQEQVDKYLPSYDPTGRGRIRTGQRVLSIHKPEEFTDDDMRRIMMGTWTGNRYDLHKLELEGLAMADQANEEFEAIFGRSYPTVEEYKCDDAEMVLVTVGSTTGTARMVIDDLQERGYKVGLVKLKQFRPFPLEKVRKALAGVKKVAVIERDISVGQCGIFYQEINWALNKTIPGDIQTYDFVAGLGGEDITPMLIEKAIRYTLMNDPPQQDPIWLGVRQEEIDDYDRSAVKIF
jgi:pyruvate ferredoxin oxidoreductase alpha subunit